MKSGHLILGLVFVAVVLFGIAHVSQNRADALDPEIISTKGIHWHPELKIFIRGEEVEIPTNLGLVGGHNPMHTHDADGVIHLEYTGVVKRDDIRLGEFFKLWGKPFSEMQIFEFQNSETEKVSMYVNGVESFEFGNYILQHEDLIEIKYE